MYSKFGNRIYWSFVEKTSVKQEHNLVVCSKLQITFLHLVNVPPLQMRLWVRFTFGQTLGQVDLWSDVPPRMRLWVMLTFGQTLGRVDLWSDVPARMRLWVRLTFGQTSGQVDLWSDVPPKMRLQVRLMFGQTLGQVDLWSDEPPRMRLWVRLTFSQTLVRLTFGQMYPLDRAILWPSVILLQVMLTCVLESKSRDNSHGNSSSIGIY